MSYVTLAFSDGNNAVLGRSTVVGGLILDACTSEELDLEAVITEHEVEEGSPISDHIKDRPDIIRISGLIGDASLTMLPSLASLAQGVGGRLSSIATRVSDALGNPFGSSVARSDVEGARSALKSAKRLPSTGRARLVQAMATLIAAKESKIATAVVTGIKYYPSLYISRVTFARDNSESGGMLKVNVTLQTVRIVSTETGTLEYPNAPQDDDSAAKNKNKKTTNKGKANQKKPTDSESGEIEAAIFTG